MFNAVLSEKEEKFLSDIAYGMIQDGKAYFEQPTPDLIQTAKKEIIGACNLPNDYFLGENGCIQGGHVLREVIEHIQTYFYGMPVNYGIIANSLRKGMPVEYLKKVWSITKYENIDKDHRKYFTPPPMQYESEYSATQKFAKKNNVRYCKEFGYVTGNMIGNWAVRNWEDPIVKIWDYSQPYSAYFIIPSAAILHKYNAYMYVGAGFVETFEHWSERIKSSEEIALTAQAFELLSRTEYYSVTAGTPDFEFSKVLDYTSYILSIDKFCLATIYGLKYRVGRMLYKEKEIEKYIEDIMHLYDQIKPSFESRMQGALQEQIKVLEEIIDIVRSALSLM
jgi:hypothetical protein